MPSATPTAPFRPQRLHWQVRRDGWVRTGLFVAFLGLIVFGKALGPLVQISPELCFIVLAGGWLAMSLANGQASRELTQATALLESQDEQAQRLLTKALRRWPLSRHLRLMLYHRLAVLRHHQGRFDQAAAIAQAVLEYDLAGADVVRVNRSAADDMTLPALGPVRANLLLLQTESYLQLHQLAGAYQALAQLRGGRLGLAESLQCLALQTRYELEAGHPQAVVQELPRKVRLAELLPAPHSAMLHAMFAKAAAALGWSTTAAWLQQRADLLGPPPANSATPIPGTPAPGSPADAGTPSDPLAGTAGL